jgi:CBS domain-containing protein
VLPASQVLRVVVPGYVQDDPALARVVDEASAERLCVQNLGGEQVGHLLASGRHRVELAVVDGDATVLECAAVMARLRSPLLAVVEGGRFRGLLTASHLLEVLLPVDDDKADDQAATKK